MSEIKETFCTMADSEKSDEPSAAAIAQPADGDQQVRSTITGTVVYSITHSSHEGSGTQNFETSI
jgi:hypothetical protein